MGDMEVEWTLVFREVFQDVQADAIDDAHYYQTSEKEQADRALLPAVRRLQQLYRDEVLLSDPTDEASAPEVAEEQWMLFLDELWLVLGRVMVAPKLHAVTLPTIAGLIGAFLGASSPTDDAGEKKKDSMDELRTEILNRLMETTKAEDKNVRLRACQMLHIILNKLAYIEEKCFGRLRKAMIPRASDKLASVRIQTVFSLKRLQDEEDAEDEVTAELVRLMVSDPSKDVRKVALENVAVTKATYRDLLIRIRDVSDDVRAVAFRVFQEQFLLKDIPIEDRAQLLDQGLQDRAVEVRQACEQMLLHKWLPGSDDSPVRLLRALDVEQSPALCTRVSKMLLKHQSSIDRYGSVTPSVDVVDLLSRRNEEPAPDVTDYLNPASVFFWREQCVYFQQEEKNETKLSSLLPTISDYLKVLLLASSSNLSEMIFVLQQLLELGRSLDYQDEFGRRLLLDALAKILRDLEMDSQLIPSVMELMAHIYALDNSQNDFVRVVAEIISDLYDPVDSMDDEDKTNEEDGQKKLTEEELDAAAARFEFLEAHMESMEYESPEYIAAQKEMEELEKLLQDPKVLSWLRCLEILAQLLKLTNFNLKHPILSGVGRYILPSIESDVPALREAGMECLGLFCLLDRQVAERHLIVFWKALNNPDEEQDVKINCIRAIMDMLFSFANLTPQIIRATPVDGDENKNEQETITTETLPLEDVFLGLAQLAATTQDDLDIQATIVEGFAKLFLMHRVRTPSVLAFLMETYFSPRLQKVQLLSDHGYQARALQLLSVFFPTFVKASTKNCTLFEEAAIYLQQQCVGRFQELSDEEREEVNQIDLVTCCKYVYHLLSHGEQIEEPVNVKTENEEEGERPKKTVVVNAHQRCAHHNRLTINLCIDVLAIEQLRCDLPRIDASLLDSRQKLLVKVLALSDISAMESRSAQLLLNLLNEISTTCFSSQRALAKSIEGIHKRLKATYSLGRRQLNTSPDTEDPEDALKQDMEWANERVDERAEAIRTSIKEAPTKTKSKRRPQAKGKRSSRRQAESSESSADSESSEDDAAGEVESSQPPARARSTRQSMVKAVDRMRSRDVAMKEAFKKAKEAEDDEDEDEDDEEEEEGESDEEDEEEESDAAEESE